MPSRSNQSMSEILTSLSILLGLPVAAFDSSGDHLITAGSLNEDIKWLRSHLTNQKVKSRHLFPNGILLISENRKMGVFFEKKGLNLATQVIHHLEFHWKAIEHYLFHDESSEVAGPDRKEQTLDKQVRQWVPQSNLWIMAPDSMGNIVLRSRKKHRLVARHNIEKQRFAKRLLNRKGTCAGKIPAGFVPDKRATHYLCLNGFRSEQNRSLVFVKEGPFSKKERQLAEHLRQSVAWEAAHGLERANQFCLTLFNCLLHQNNSKQLLSFIFSKFAGLLPFDAFGLIWLDPTTEKVDWCSHGAVDSWSDSLESLGTSLIQEIGPVQKIALAKLKSGVAVFSLKAWQPNSSTDLLCLPLLDEDRLLGFVLLGQDITAGQDIEFNSPSSEEQPEWHQLAKTLTRLLKSSIYDSQRESRFLEIGDAYTQLLEDYSELKSSSQLLETRVDDLRIGNGHVTQVFRYLKSRSLQVDPEAMLNAFFRLARSVSSFELVGIALPVEGRIDLFWSSEDEMLSTMAFSEMEGGVYHDLLFTREPLYWDGSWPRKFLLPSGHPMVHNSFFIPFETTQGQDAILMLANHLSGLLHGGVKSLMIEVLQLEGDRIIEALPELLK